MSYHRQLVEAAKARRRFFDAPPNGRYSSELDIDLSPESMRRERERKQRRVIRIVNRDVPQTIFIQRDDGIKRLPNLTDIIRAVAKHFNVSVAGIKSPQRGMHVMRPRQVYYLLAHECALATFAGIGRFCGGRDHTSAMSGIKKMQRVRHADPQLASDIAAIRSALSQRFDIAQEAGE